MVGCAYLSLLDDATHTLLVLLLSHQCLRLGGVLPFDQASLAVAPQQRMIVVIVTEVAHPTHFGRTLSNTLHTLYALLGRVVIGAHHVVLFVVGGWWNTQTHDTRGTIRETLRTILYICLQAEPVGAQMATVLLPGCGECARAANLGGARCLAPVVTGIPSTRAPFVAFYMDGCIWSIAHDPPRRHASQCARGVSLCLYECVQKT